MKTQRGFIGVGLLIVIVLGLIVVGGGAYYVIHQQTPSPTSSDNTLDNSQTLPTTNTQTSQQTQVMANTSAQNNSVPTISISNIYGRTIMVQYSGFISTEEGPTPPSSLWIQNEGYSKPTLEISMDGAASGKLTFTLPANAPAGNYTITPVGIPTNPIHKDYGIGPGYMAYGKTNAIISASFNLSSGGTVSAGNSTATSQQNTTSNLQTYTSSDYGFSISYDPSIFKTYTNSSGYMGKPDYTNTLLSLFYGAGSITFREDKATTYEDCLRNSTDTKNVAPIVINGITFYKSSSGDAALGHSLSVDTYRTYYNGACYEIHTWIESDRTGDGSTYTDTTKEKTYLQNVLNTFKFNVSQTQPAIHSSTQPDWKTYTGTSAPVTFSYPGNYFVTETADNGYGNQIDINPGSKVGLDFVAQGTFTSNIEIQKSFVNPNDNIGTLQKSMDFDAGNKQNYYSPITIGGVQGYVGGFSNLQNSFGQSNTASIHFQKGNTLYRILLYGPISTDVYNTFVNSFKFTN